MLTITILLVFIGALVAALAHYWVKKNRLPFLLELVISIFGSFLGTLIEVWVRGLFPFPMVVLIVFQFIIPLFSAVIFIVILRLTNNKEE